MSRKDYRTVAECIRVQLEMGHADEKSARCIAEALALEFHLDNPRFDRTKFLSACGVE